MAAKSKALAAVAAILVIGGGWLAWDSMRRDDSSVASSNAPSSLQNPVSGSNAAREVLATHRSDAMVNRYACKGDPARCETELLGANSAEEAQWLRDRGYPSRDQIDAGRSFSVEQLRLQANDSGALVDVNLYAQGLLREQRHREALGVLLDSFATEGNLYALHLVADVHANSQELKNLPLAMAYLRLAYLAGDAKAGTVLAERFSSAAPAELAYADKRAAELRSQLNPGGTWPRP